MRTNLRDILAPLAALLAAVLLTGCWERPPVTSVQNGYRGLGMVGVYNPRTLETQMPGNAIPAALPEAAPGAPLGTTVYKNIQVLKDLSLTEHVRLMTAFTLWVAPKDQGCAYCHDLADFSLDTKYTKVVARRMIQLTRDLNTNWKSHVASSGAPGAGVTCHTCHRGQPVPANIWFTDPGPKSVKGPAGGRNGQNLPAAAVGLTSMAYDPFTTFLTGKPEQIRVIAPTALPVSGASTRNIMQTEATYSLMFHLSSALGVNCTYCHNSRSFASWEGPPQRAFAWYGIQMVREINTAYLEPLGKALPAKRLGPTGDAPKANCATCHQGAFKPLYGVPQLLDYPELAGPKAIPVTSAAVPDAARKKPAAKS
ncbi:MAG: photosynthetic reaction center cytochrome c subunit [Betaproteobacteria bacterium]|nr:photosynthetic reaction center cytochrome c subunit [Betaproteobacteria bacterium]